MANAFIPSYHCCQTRRDSVSVRGNTSLPKRRSLNSRLRIHFATRKWVIYIRNTRWRNSPGKTGTVYIFNNPSMGGEEKYRKRIKSIRKEDRYLSDGESRSLEMYHGEIFPRNFGFMTKRLSTSAVLLTVELLSLRKSSSNGRKCCRTAGARWTRI